MATVIGTLKYNTDLDTGGVEKGSSKVKSMLGDIGKTAAGFVLGGAISKAPGQLLDMAKAAAEDEASMLRLDKSLQNYLVTQNNGADISELGAEFSELKDDMDELISQGQKLAFSDDEVRDSMQFLLAATDDYGESAKRQKAAMDLARGANIPLATATKMLGKLNAENVEVFKKLGITLGEDATEADALAAVQKKFAGQAKEYGKSTAGQFAQAGIAISEIKESIGYALLPVLAKLGQAATKYLPMVQEFIGELSETISKKLVPIVETAAEVITTKIVPALLAFAQTNVLPTLQNIADAIMNVIIPAVSQFAMWVSDKLKGPLESVINFLGGKDEVLKALGIAIAIVTTAVIAWTVAQTALNLILAVSPFGLILAAIVALVAVAVLIVRNWDDITAAFQRWLDKHPAIMDAFNKIKDVGQTIVDWITGDFVPAVKKIYETIAEWVGKAIDFVTDNWDKIQAVIEPALNTLGTIVEGAWKQIQTTFKTAFGIIEGLLDVFIGVFTGDWDRAWEGVKRIAQTAWNGIKETVSNGIGLIRGLAGIAGDAGRALGSAILEGIKNGIVGAAGFAWDLASGLVSAVKNLINAHVIDRINRALEFTIVMPGDIPNFHVNPPDIPRLAEGGIITRAMLAQVGEGNRPEAVIPLDRIDSVLGDLQPAGNSYFISALDARSFEQYLEQNMGVLVPVMNRYNERRR